MGEAPLSHRYLPCSSPNKVRKDVDRQWRPSPLSALSEYSRPVVVSPLKRPNDGQRRVPLRSGWTPSLHDTWG